MVKVVGFIVDEGKVRGEELYLNLKLAGQYARAVSSSQSSLPAGSVLTIALDYIVEGEGIKRDIELFGISASEPFVLETA